MYVKGIYENLVRYQNVYTALGIFIFFATIYLSFPSRNNLFDGLAYAAAIDSGRFSELFNPNHLLYNLIGLLSTKLLNIFNPSLPTVYACAYLNGLLGAVGLVIFFSVLRRFGIRTLVAFFYAVLLGSSFGYWAYATDSEVAVISAVAFFLFVLVLYRSYTKPTIRNFIISGTVYALTVFAHQSNVILYVPIFLSFVIYKRWKGLIFFNISFFGVILVIYLAVGFLIIEVNNVSEFVNWVTRIASNKSGSWGLFSPLTPAWTIFGYLHYLVGGHYILGISAVSNLADNLFRSSFLTNHLKIGKSVPLYLTYGLLLATLVLVYLFIYHIIYLVRNCFRPIKLKLGVFFSAAFLTYASFFCWWNPHHVEFLIIPVSCLLLILAQVTPSRSSLCKAFYGFSLVGLLFVINFFGSILPFHNETLDPDLQLTLTLQKRYGNDTFILVNSDFGLRFIALYPNFLRIPYAPSVLEKDENVETLGEPFFRENVGYIVISDRVFEPPRQYPPAPHIPLYKTDAVFVKRIVKHNKKLQIKPGETVWEINDVP